jgi:hypothetical protein
LLRSDALALDTTTYIDNVNMQGTLSGLIRVVNNMHRASNISATSADLAFAQRRNPLYIDGVNISRYRSATMPGKEQLETP